MFNSQDKKQQSLESGDSSYIQTSGGDLLQETNKDMEEINGMVDKLLSLSVTSKEGEILTASNVETKKLSLVQDTQGSSTGSRYFPLRSDVPDFVPNNGSIKYLKSYPMTGPDDAKILQFVAKTGYPLVVSPRQRKYGHPPSNWKFPEPGKGCQVFVGKIPKQLFEDVLVPVFLEIGPLYGMRIMMEGHPSVLSRGFAFVTYTCSEDAAQAEKSLDGFEIMAGRFLKVALSEPNCRVFVGNVSKTKTVEDIKEHILVYVEDAVDVTAFKDPVDPKMNRGFCFIDFKSHSAASHGKKRLLAGVDKIFGQQVYADWADPLIEPDDQSMIKATSILVTKLSKNTTQADLFEMFRNYGDLQAIEVLENSAKIHYETHEEAVKAVQAMHEKTILGMVIGVSLLKPRLSVTDKAEIMFRRYKRKLNAVNESLRASNPNLSVVLPTAVQMFLLKNIPQLFK